MARPSRTTVPAYEARDPTAVVHKPLPHDSARLHVSGAAAYVDDIREPQGTLHVAIGMADKASGRLRGLDLAAVRAAPGVVAVLSAADIPGKNDVAPVFADEPLLAFDEVLFHGQALFIVVGRTRDAARRATRLARIDITETPPALTVADAIESGGRVQPDYAYGRGDVEAALAAAPYRLEGQLGVGGQEHFYLEGQVSLAIPGESGEISVHCSTQDPTEVQHIVARVLALPDAFVTVETRRMGGGFGGKESQACAWAALAALAARATGAPCKVRLDRDDDFILTGKRHDFRNDWRVGFDAAGRVSAYDVMLNARCGCSADLSPGVVDRAMFHAGNCYWLPDVHIASRRLKTNTVSNTAFRGFGGPQGMLAIERVMDAIARERGLDPLDVRKANFLRGGGDRTPYGQTLEDCDTLPAMIDDLEASSDYRARRAEIAGFNATSPILKRGIALTPVMFGISFTLIHLNQAGALVHVYTDGSIHLSHGGTEMGQGLHTKVAQVVAEQFGVPLDWVRITATNTAKVPNASPTAASSGTDINGMAALNGARQIRSRMAAVAAEQWNVAPEAVEFRDGRVFGGNASMGFAELARACRISRVQLSAAGYYKTPEIHWDRATATGKPFFYFAFGAACCEAAIDTLTGEMKILRADLLHDVGASLNPALDLGQVEGGFIQGLGWLTTEELVFDAKGRLTTHAPSTYKIPVASDAPPQFFTRLHMRPNAVESIYRSKAVGEPPLMLAIAGYSAILDAVHATAPKGQPTLEAPCTPEAILKAIRSIGG
ncbi:MAG: xanthine dehydrogenase molybdopterin binding subunit [Bradyrhizobium sp.]|nr:MAG: xanthine dehydrogenase molybdopterin binding subunit [Bradyrhizobium sp.]